MILSINVILIHFHVRYNEFSNFEFLSLVREYPFNMLRIHQLRDLDKYRDKSN